MSRETAGIERAPLHLRRLYSLVGGVRQDGEVDSEDQGAAEADPGEIRALRQQVLERIAQTDGLPALPQLIDRLDRVISDPRSNAKAVADVLKLEPSLAAQMLRLVNSAVFGLPRKVTQLDQAVVFMGLREVRSLAMLASVLSVFRGPWTSSFDHARFWQHSLAVAIGCRRIARSLNDKGEEIDVENAFLAGLCHDFGKILLARHFPTIYEDACKLVTDHSIPLHDAEMAQLGIHHGDIGGLLLRRWEIDETVAAAVTLHHDPPAERLPEIVHLADHISRALGLTADESAWPRLNPAVLSSLDLSDDVTEATARHVLEDFEEIQSVIASEG